MLNTHDAKIIERGIKAAETRISEENKIWSRYSNDKVDIGEELTKVIRTLNKSFPLSKPLRALSIGSSAEPQFRILETAFRKKLYLMDVEKRALDVVKERIKRQHTAHVSTIRKDYNKIFLNTEKTRSFRKNKLEGKRVNLITLHHSLYYSDENSWLYILRNLCREILSAKGAIHIVLMAAHSRNASTTTWLYNHFVNKFFGKKNTQDLIKFEKSLNKIGLSGNPSISARTNHVRFFVDDFEKFMGVVWMILLYPTVHNYSQKQKEEIAEFVYKKFWKNKNPLIQTQDHLMIYRGITIKK
ncbi:MAG: class I SAM-dependent methyltransferase [Candidatus Omnitrophota bacterium]